MNFTINIRDHLIIKTLCGFALGFLLAGIIGHIVQYGLDMSPFLYRWFNTDGEKNFPAAFSCGLLLSSSALLWVITAYKRAVRDRFTPYWGGLAILFGALAMDEWLSFHEKLSDVIRPWLPATGIFHFAWIVAGMTFLAIIALVYWRFLMHLDRSCRQGFLTAASIFIVGAIGMEMLSGYYVDTHQQWNYHIWLGLTTIEEGLEMFGVIVFIRTLLTYIQTCVGDITVCVGPSTKEKVLSPATKAVATTSRS
ncbi:MAG: hypothetical protein ACFB16_14720 [Phormidesmis sp.]